MNDSCELEKASEAKEAKTLENKETGPTKEQAAEIILVLKAVVDQLRKIENEIYRRLS